MKGSGGRKPPGMVLENMNKNENNITQWVDNLGPIWCRTCKTDIKGAEPSPNTRRRVLRGGLLLPEGLVARYGPNGSVAEVF